MASIEIVNTTPLQLQLRQYYSETRDGWLGSKFLANVEPLGQPAMLELPDGETLWVCANAGRSSVASFTVGPDARRFVVTPTDVGYSSVLAVPPDALVVTSLAKTVLRDRYRPRSGPEITQGLVNIGAIDSQLSLLMVSSLTFINATDVNVDLSFIDGRTRSETQTGLTLSPGSRHVELHEARLDIASSWLARATFTRELLGMFVPSPDAEQTFTITDAFAKRAVERFPMPSPLPPITSVSLVGDARPRPRHRDHIVVVDRDHRTRPVFNTRKDVATRSVTISGVELVWDPVRDNEYALMRFAGESVLDLEVLEMYADRVVIATPLRFPGTNVTIHARELEFKASGQIDTTPIGFGNTAARAEYHLPDGVTPADKDGNPTYQPADGLDGQPGGDIGLYVGTLTLPKGGEKAQRFVARGSAGQTAETGGKRPYAPKDASEPKKEDGKTRPGITAQMIKNRLWDAMPVAKGEKDWRWPWGYDGPGSIPFNGFRDKPLMFPDKDGNVVDLQVVLHDDVMLASDTNWLCFPSGTRDTRTGSVANGTAAPSWKAVRPGSGEDAYPGGKPGDGGRGGIIRTSLSLGLVVPLCDAAGGASGPTTPAVAGGEPGGPTPAYKVVMDLVKRTWPLDSDRYPRLVSEQVVAARGADAPARQGKPGETSSPEAVDRSWLQPEVAEAVLAFCRDAYRNGYRDLARRMLEPYYIALRSATLVGELQPAFVSIEGMRANMLDNLDYYGNPPGWVPRLRLSTNLEIFQATRKIAAKLVYYGQATEQKYASLEHADDLVKDASKALGEELDFSTARLKDAYTDLATAYVDLQDARDKLQAAQATINVLKTLAAESALDVAERQRLFKGITKLVSGVLQAVPIGQPYVGLAGSGLSSIADINFTDPNKIPGEIGKALGKFGTTTDTFLKENADLLVDDRVRGLRDKLQLSTTNIEDLEDQLTKTKGANDNLSGEVTRKSAELEKQWTSERTEQLRAVEAMRTSIQNRIDATMADNELMQQLAEVPGGRTLWRQRQQLSRQIDLLKQAIAAEQAQPEGKRRDALKKELQADTAKLEEFKTKIASLEKEHAAAKKVLERGSPALETQKAEWQKTFQRLQGMGKGLTTIGEGIATLGTQLSKDDPDVQALAKTMLASSRNAAYQALVGKLDDLGKANRTALARCTDAQNKINREVVRISQNLSAQNALSRTRQSIEGVLDVQTVRYLRAMQERGRDMLRWSVYNLVMAWRYEFLRDVSDDVYNLDKITARLGGLASVGSDGKVRTLSEADLQGIEDIVVNDVLWAEWKKVVTERQKRAIVRQKNHAVCQLTKPQLDQLRTTGLLRFNLVRDFQAGNFDWVDARIVDFKVEDIVLDSPEQNLNLRIIFRHSGESILLGSDKKTYSYFCAGRDDDPIWWGFGYAHSDKWTALSSGKPWDPSKNKDLITKDAPDPELDDLLNKVINPTNSTEKIQYREYLPSYFSDITLRLSRGAQWDPAAITSLSNLVFRVDYALAYER